MRRVESLANPASILIDFASMGSVPSQSANKSADNFFGLMSSLRRTQKSSLGYSGSGEADVADDAPSSLDGLVIPPEGKGLSDE
jgi:hypothetical protein